MIICCVGSNKGAPYKVPDIAKRKCPFCGSPLCNRHSKLARQSPQDYRTEVRVCGRCHGHNDAKMFTAIK